MADEIRTLSALQALFPDNNTGDITPQDLRDFLVSSLSRSDTGMLASQSALLPVTVTPTLIDVWTVDGGGGGATPDQASGKITIDRPGDWSFYVNLSVTHDPDVFFKFEVRRNQLDIGFQDRLRVENAGDSNRVFIIGALDFVANDEIELFVSHEGTGSFNFEVHSGQFFIERQGD